MTTEIFMVTGESAVHVVVPPGEYIIGRDEEADIQIPDDSVSARHARLVVDRESVCIQDLDSGNGTFVEGEPAVGLTSLYDGQSALLGSVSLRVRQSTDPQSLGEGPRYVRGGMVAYGGMGAIHEARQSVMGRKVAMKVMLHSWNASSVKRFLDEARITGMLEHPNIVPVHEMGVDEEDQFFYTMKFVRGATLAEVLAGLTIGNEDSVKNFSLAVLLTIFQKVCDAVAFAHSRGVFHRDLKPENIMIGDFGEVLVMDWGLAKESGFVSLEAAADGEAVPAPETATGNGSASLRTIEGMVLGTPTYMSPEQARGEASAVDHRSDIYSLGAILHEILYLQTPVRGKNRERVIEKVAAGERDAPEPRALPHLPAQRAPASLEAVCHKAMAFQSAQRYQEVTDLQADIAAYQSGFATSAESAGLGKHLLLFIRRNRGVSLAVAAGLAVLLVSSVLFTVNLVRERNRAEAALAEAENKERLRQDALEEKRVAESEKDSSERRANVERDQREVAQAREKEATMTAEEQQRMIEQSEKNKIGDAKRFFRMAQTAVAQGRPEDALQLLNTAVDYAPGNADYLKYHGLALLALGRYGNAAERFQQVLKIDPGADMAKALAKAKELQTVSAKEGELSTEVTTALERFLIGGGYPLYVRLLDAESQSPPRVAGATGEEEAQADLAGEEFILSRLGDVAGQAGWRNSRVSKLQDGLYRLDLSGLKLESLPDLSGTGVTELDIGNTAVADISPLRGLSLRHLNLAGTKVSDLLPLRGMTELESLVCSGSVSDLSPLQGAPLRSLDLRGSRVKSLEPLRDTRLKTLLVGGTKISDLAPVAGQPIEELDAEVKRLDDPRQVEGMKNLVKLKLPPGTGPLDAGAMPALQEISIPDLRPEGPMSGDEYRELESLRRKAWEQHGSALERLGLKNFGPDRLLVRQKGETFDLDLRGTGISDFKPLARLPVHRLFVDTDSEPLDLGPLGSHPTLRHLSLEKAWVPSIARLLQNKQLSSLVLSRVTADTLLLAKHPGLERIGYTLGEDGLLPAGTAEDFFGSRAPDRTAPGAMEEKPKYAFTFDSAGEGTGGWTVDYGGKEPPVPLWTADPVAEGGAGGGYISFYERIGNGFHGRFVASPAIERNQRDLYGGILEFRLRLGRDLGQKERVHVELISGDRKLVHLSGQWPSAEWLDYSVPLSLAGNWRVGGAQGPLATDVDLRESLQRLREIRINAEFASDHLDERTDLDSVALWRPADEKAGAR